MRRRHRLALAVLPCALLLSAPIAAQQVYKWKDANGVTQYTATPPPEGSRYEIRGVDRRQAPQPGAEAGPAEDPACTIARNNVVLLQGKSAVGPDGDGDGKPDRPFTEAERADQLALAEATAKVKCAAAAPADGAQAEPEEE